MPSNNLSPFADSFPKNADAVSLIISEFLLLLELQSTSIKTKTFSVHQLKFSKAKTALQFQLSELLSADTYHSSAPTNQSVSLQVPFLSNKKRKQIIRASKHRESKSPALSPPLSGFQKYLQDCNDGKYQANGCLDRRNLRSSSPKVCFTLPSFLDFRTPPSSCTYVISTINLPASKSPPCIISLPYYDSIKYDSDSNSDSDSDSDFDSQSESDLVPANWTEQHSAVFDLFLSSSFNSDGCTVKVSTSYPAIHLKVLARKPVHLHEYFHYVFFGAFSEFCTYQLKCCCNCGSKTHPRNFFLCSDPCSTCFPLHEDNLICGSRRHHKYQCPKILTLLYQDPTSSMFRDWTRRFHDYLCFDTDIPPFQN